MSLLYFIIACLMCAIGGFLVGRKLNKDASAVDKLKDELDNTQRKLNEYQYKVANHLDMTADLVEQFTKHYKTLHEHLDHARTELTDTPEPLSLTNDKARDPKIDMTQATAEFDSENEPEEVIIPPRDYYHGHDAESEQADQPRDNNAEKK